MNKENFFTVDDITPNDKNIEEVILGSMILEREGCDIGMRLLTNEAFYNGKNLIIFNALKSVYNRKEPIDIITVTNELKSTKELEKIGGSYHLTTLTNRVASSINLEHHCFIILELSIKRKLIEISKNIIRKGYDASEDVFDIISYCENEIKKINTSLPSQDISDNNKTIDKVIENIQKARLNGGITGYSTGIKSLDNAWMGLNLGNKYVIAASPGEGKTSLVKSICINLSHKQNLPGVFFSQDMIEGQLMTSCISEILKISNNRIQKGEITEDQERSILSLKETLFTKNFLIVPKSGIDPYDMRNTLKKLVISHGIKWFAIDYIGLQRLKGNYNKNKSPEQVISEITAENKITCKELNLIGFELAQFTKEAGREDQKRPKINYLKGSSSIEADADIVSLIWRPEKHGIKILEDGRSTEDYAEIIIEKNRLGPLGTVEVRYQSHLTKFSDFEENIELIDEF